MFITPYFGGCKYTNYFLFINKNIEFQWLGLLITFAVQPSPHGSRVWLAELEHGFMLLSSAPLICLRKAMPSARTTTNGDRCAAFLTFGRTAIAKTGVKAIKRLPLCRVSGITAYSGRKELIFEWKRAGLWEMFYSFAMTSWHFERDVANDRRERTCKR